MASSNWDDGNITMVSAAVCFAIANIGLLFADQNAPHTFYDKLAEMIAGCCADNANLCMDITKGISSVFAAHPNIKVNDPVIIENRITKAIDHHQRKMQDITPSR